MIGRRWALLLAGLLFLGAGCAQGLPSAVERTPSASDAPLAASPTPFAPPAPAPSPAGVLLPTPQPREAAPTSTPAPPRPGIALLISVDGLRPDALRAAQAPFLLALAQRGAFSWRAQTVLPSVTLPAHASMLTGRDVFGHGITWNDWQPARGYVRVPTLFSLAKERGLRTAMVVGKAKLRHLAPPGTVDLFEQPGLSAGPIAQRAAALLREGSFDLLFVHFPDPDSAGHARGWMSPEQLASIAGVDAAIATLWEAIQKAGKEEETLLLVTADHGGREYGHGSARPADVTIPWIIAGPGIRQGWELQGEVRLYDTAPTLLCALGLPVLEDMEGKPITEAFAIVPACLTAWLRQGYRRLHRKGCEAAVWE